MSMTDPIADFLARIRTAILARQAEVLAPSSKLKQRLCVVLKDEGYIAGYDVRYDDNGMAEIIVRLRWADPRTKGAFGPGHRDPVDVQGPDDRPRRPQGRPGRRASLRSLVRRRS